MPIYLVSCETLEKLRRAFQNWRRGMLRKGVSILHDTARPHVARHSVALLQNFGWNFITHPPYSLHVTRSDYHLCPKAASGYDMAIVKPPQCLQKCIDRNGDYVGI
uniref:Histone-lysine N-methyltransferase SETMAR n=1 Tax=Neolamprologus brichardi TaxID=32507 RepID=A0A3Q4I8C2_NEOBR